MGLEVVKSTTFAGICPGCELEGGVVSDLGQIPRGPQVISDTEVKDDGRGSDFWRCRVTP